MVTDMQSAGTQVLSDVGLCEGCWYCCSQDVSTAYTRVIYRIECHEYNSLTSFISLLDCLWKVLVSI
jgi:hypothetical protein